MATHSLKVNAGIAKIVKAYEIRPRDIESLKQRKTFTLAFSDTQMIMSWIVIQFLMRILNTFRLIVKKILIVCRYEAVTEDVSVKFNFF